MYWSAVPGMKYIDIPDNVYDKDITVLAVLLDGPVDLYREKGQVIESN
jgi:alpha-L-fucosidase